MKRLIVGITGATGACLGIRLLEMLQDSDIETHLIISKWGRQTLEFETKKTVEDINKLADVVHNSNDMGACISSGSFLHSAMVIVPCSMRTVAAIAHGNGDTLIHRAADVVMKERRRLVLVARETPISPIHLENMLKLSRLGVTIMPPMPSFYNFPETIEDIVDYTVARILDQFDIPSEISNRWTGEMNSAPK